MILVCFSGLKINTITFDLKEVKNKHNKCIKIVLHWNLHGKFEKFLWKCDWLNIKSQAIFTCKSNCSLSNQSWIFEHLKFIVTRWIFFSFFGRLFYCLFFLNNLNLFREYYTNYGQTMVLTGTVFFYSLLLSITYIHRHQPSLYNPRKKTTRWKLTQIALSY